MPLLANPAVFLTCCWPRTVSAMRLTDQDIQEFGDIWKRAFKEDLSRTDARHHASQLLELFALLAKALPSESQSRQVNPSLCDIFSTAENLPRTKIDKCFPLPPSEPNSNGTP